MVVNQWKFRIARILSELIYNMFKDDIEFIDNMDFIARRKINSMPKKSLNTKVSDRTIQSCS